MKTYESLKDALLYYGVRCNEPYYISSGNPIFEFPKIPFRIDFYVLCVCTSGNIKIEIDNHEYDISQNGLLISAPSTILQFGQISPDFRMRLLFFEKNFLLKNFSDPFFVEKLDLFINTTFSVCRSTEEYSNRLFNLFDYLQEQVQRKGRFIDEIIKTVIFNLLFEAAYILNKERTLLDEKAHQETNHLFYRFNNMVKENILDHKDVKYYADQLCITDKYLIKVVKKATGKTPHYIIDEYLIKEACVKLGYPDYSILQIALDLGFNSTSSFGRFFKKYTSISLADYRKQSSHIRL